MIQSSGIAIATVHSILVVIDIVGNCLVCAIIKKHRDMRYVETKISKKLQQKQNKQINFIIIHQTHYEKSDLSRVFNQFTIACEHDMINTNICCRYCIYHVKFNVCLVTNSLGVFSSETKWLNASLLFLSMNYVKNT